MLETFSILVRRRQCFHQLFENPQVVALDSGAYGSLDKVVARETLFERIWGYDMSFNSNSLEVYVYRIRKKVEADPNNPRYLKTVRGYGYSLSS